MSVRSLMNMFILGKRKFLAQRTLFRAIQDEEMHTLVVSVQLHVQGKGPLSATVCTSTIREFAGSVLHEWCSIVNIDK